MRFATPPLLLFLHACEQYYGADRGLQMYRNLWKVSAVYSCTIAR